MHGFLFSIDYLDMEEWMNNNWRYLEELIWRYFLENKDTNLMKSNCNLYVQLTQCQQLKKKGHRNLYVSRGNKCRLIITTESH